MSSPTPASFVRKSRRSRGETSTTEAERGGRNVRGGRRGGKGGRTTARKDEEQPSEVDVAETPSVSASDTSLFFALVESYLLAHPSATRDEAERVITRDICESANVAVPPASREEDAATIRARQDIEFIESSQEDARKQEVAEERQRALEFERNRRETAVAREPPELPLPEGHGDAAVLHVMVRMPLGDKLLRRFRRTDPVDLLFRWVDAHVVYLYADVTLEHPVPLCSSLVSRDPVMKLVASDAGRAITFAEAGVMDKSVFFVET